MMLLRYFLVSSASHILCLGFISSPSFGRGSFRKLFLSPSIDDINEMTVDEMKSELEVRGVGYEDCVSKMELASRLLEVRNKGKADPDIIDKFNANQGAIDTSILDSEEIVNVTASDGNLPGGLSPELMKVLGSDPTIVQMLKDPKMQKIMKDVMTSGPDSLKKYLSDPDAVILLDKLGQAMQRIVGPMR